MLPEERVHEVGLLRKKDGRWMSSEKSLQKAVTPDDRKTTVAQHAKDLDTDSRDHAADAGSACRLQRVQPGRHAGRKFETGDGEYAN